ncbi:COG3650 family protein [Brevundimonas lenta]|uniref:Putative membrane protein n=1 Tax=Brevundimonas lenta TaxID=424796 RepID=A0A7W6NMY9_9CAUL|nr:hypothetical protein [Brevundimonas lenta]MBB4081243.1 putative membrane protein [Brevundimonas lenta]
MVRPCLILVSAAALSACASAAPPTAPSPVLAGVNLDQPVRALGTEPFWSLEAHGEALVFTGVDRPEQHIIARREVQNDAVVYRGTTTGGLDLMMKLNTADCSDGMSDRIYPLTARVEFAGERLTGCAASVAAIMSAGESGRVVESNQTPD